MGSEKRLVITADDFGVAPEVNEAVDMAHREGVLTAASLMVGSPGAADAVDRARRLPKLGVGLHVVLVEGRPVLPPDQVPDLVTADGAFRNDMAAAAVAMFFRPKVRRQLYAEIKAQFEAFAATGLPLDHVNTHLHFHLHPTILGAILKLGPRYGMKAMRAPIEPRAVLEQVEPGVKVPPAVVTEPWARLVRARLTRAGIACPDQVFGLHWTGQMTADRVRGLIEHLPEGFSEIYLHPATKGGFVGAAKGARYETELAALVDAGTVAAVQASGVQIGGFAAVG
jgi:hopanoid biosynthesis associated protein HpnK